MILTKYGRYAEKFVTDNSAAILTAVGVVGTVSTAYLTGRATFKAAEILAIDTKHREFSNEEVERSERSKGDAIKLVWKVYIPAVASGVTTVSCIVYANRINTRRAAALAAAYSLTEKNFSDYKEKVLEKVGVKKEQDVRDSLAQDRVNNDPLSNRGVIITGSGDVLCYDTPTGRYFTSDMETLRRIQNDVNQGIISNNGYAPLSDFYVALGLTTTPYSEEVGWTLDKLFEVQFSATLAEDSRPCITIDYAVVPIRGYDRLP